MRLRLSTAVLLSGLFCFTWNPAPVQAQESTEPVVTKEQYVRQRLQWARNNPRWNPTREELEAQFDEMDTEGVGYLTEDQLEAARAARQAQREQGLTKQQYVRQRLQWARNNPRWNPTREELEARFDELDTDGDGILTEEELEAGRAERPGRQQAVTREQRDQGLTKEQYVRQRLQWARNNPRWNPTREELEARFDELDTDGDGFLSEAELEAGRAERPGRQQAVTREQRDQGLTKEQYVRQRLQWARNNPRWNPTREELEARFDELDTDGDGILTEEELEAGRRNR